MSLLRVTLMSILMLSVVAAMGAGIYSASSSDTIQTADGYGISVHKPN